MKSLWNDVRYGGRLLVNQPGFTAVAVLSLALGIGANTTIFSVLNALLFQPLPIRNVENVVFVYTSDFSGPPYGSSSYPDYVDFRDQTDVFADLVAASPTPLTLTATGVSEQAIGGMVTGNYFSFVGLEPALGRAFLAEEDRTPGTHPVVVLSHAYWQRRFGSDRGILGQTLQLNGQPFTVIGVGPERFSGHARILPVDLWVPMMMQPQLSLGRDRLTERGSRGLGVMGHLKPGVSPEQAQAALTHLAERLQEAHRPYWTDVREERRRITVLRESDARVPPSARGSVIGFLGLLAGVVGLVLLIACANVANLLLARASRRQKEVAIRLSLGAGRTRLVRQLLTESVLLASVGGALGILLAYWSLGLLLAFKPPIPIPVEFEFQMDTNVLWFTAGLAVLTGILFGLAPALQASKPNLVSTLKDDSGSSGGGLRRMWLRNGFIVAQFGLSLLLLIGAGLFLRSLANAGTIDPGFDSSNLVMMSVNLRLSGYSEERGRQFFEEAGERLGSLPGMETVTVSSAVPLSLFGSRRGTFIEGYGRRPGEDMEFHFSIVGPEYFETMKIPIVLGRGLGPQDREGSLNAVVVNETFAGRFWPGVSPLGRRMSVSGPEGDMLEVVGVARNGKYNTLGEDPTPFFYLPFRQNYRPDMTIIARAAVEPGSLLNPAREEIRKIDGNLPVTDVKTMREHLGVSLFPARLAAAMLSIFGLVAVALAGVGIYGVMSFVVSQRTQEIGLRIALGAEKKDVLRFVIGRGMGLAAVGAILGLGAAFATTRFLGSLLYVSALDPLTFVAIPLLLSMVALAACYIPARRAAAMDAIAALRYE